MMFKSILLFLIYIVLKLYIKLKYIKKNSMMFKSILLFLIYIVLKLYIKLKYIKKNSYNRNDNR